jgi:predicted O-linked N-acetylglucosamine transferase (SPINDLY family)
MASIAEALQFAISHHVAGRLDLAEQIYRQITEQVPQHPDAWHLLGVIKQQIGKLPESLELIDRAIAISDNQSAYHSNRGETLRQLGRIPEAEQSLRRAIELDPHAADALNNLGLLLNNQNRFSAAVEMLNRAVTCRPEFPEALNNRGLALRALGKSDAAIADFRRAISLRPNFADAHHNLGTELHRLRRLDEATAEYRAALTINPNYVDALNAMALAVHEQEQFAEAESLLRRALAIRPQFPDALANLGLLLIGQRRYAESRDAFDAARRLEPQRPKHHVGLALAHSGLDELVAARDHARAAVELDAKDADAWQQLGNMSLGLGDVTSAIDAFRQAVELSPKSNLVHSSYLFLQLYDPAMTPERLAELASEYDRRHVQPFLPREPRWNVSGEPSRPLRIGFVSSDLREHPVGFFMTGVLEHLDRTEFTTYCYSDHRRDDVWAKRLQRAAGVWRVIDQRSDEELAEIIRQDQIDILIDLAGHSVPNRLPVFARRPAPVQATWMGYAGTTGSAAFDFIIADRWLVPPGDESGYRERVIRLPDSNVCLTLDEDLPPVAPPPSLASGRVTFGSFLNPAKLTPLTYDLWSAVLRKLPESRLILKFRGLNEPQVADRICGALVERRVDRGRIELRGHTPLRQMLGEYGEIDVALDTFPYTGGTTTMYALLMGVPLVTLAGRTMVSRQSLAILEWLGQSDLVAASPEDYVAKVTQLASDPARLGALRHDLRRLIRESTLGNPQRFVVGLQATLRQMWISS